MQEEVQLLSRVRACSGSSRCLPLAELRRCPAGCQQGPAELSDRRVSGRDASERCCGLVGATFFTVTFLNGLTLILVSKEVVVFIGQSLTEIIVFTYIICTFLI